MEHSISLKTRSNSAFKLIYHLDKLIEYVQNQEKPE